MAGVVGGFELDGRDIAERFVEPVVVEPVDVFEDRELELAAGAPDAVFYQLGLERTDEALSQALSNASPTGPTDAST